jgi:hypothetical protein
MDNSINEVFMASRFRDFPILLRAVRGCREFFGAEHIIVASPKQHVKAMQFGLRGEAEVIDEGTLTKNMKVFEFRSSNVPFFPKAFGWYYQQILKMNYARMTSAKNYLVWDADTIPLKSIPFFDSNGRVYFTTAEEYHAPYFHTYEQLLGEKPAHNNSFISQHMIVNTAVMRNILEHIESIHQVDDWTQALLQVLCKSPYSQNLFSEYETYANYFASRFPDRMTIRSLQWSREENTRTWGVSYKKFKRAQYLGDAFIALESKKNLASRIFLKTLEISYSDFIKSLAVAIVSEKTRIPAVLSGRIA